MNNETKLHDLLLFGSNLHGVERMEAINTLAKMLKVSPGKVEIMLEKKSVVLLKAVSREVAQKYERKLSAIGFKCNTRPCNESGAELELVPLEKMLQSLCCPSCGHVHKFAEGEDAPEICESCNIVFAKVSQNLKLEREKIKRALLAKSKLEEKALQEENQRRQEEERRRRLEEEIRKELGLPRFVTRRSTLISSATGIFALGLLLGVGGVVAYDSLNDMQEDPYSLAEQPMDAGTKQASPGVLAGHSINAGPTGQILPNLPPETVAGMDPVMVTHMQVAGMLDVQSGLNSPLAGISAGTVSAQPAFSDDGNTRFSSLVAGGSQATLGDKPQVTTDLVALPPVASAAGDADSRVVRSASEFIHGMFDDLDEDAEWDDTILQQVFALAAKGRVETALTLTGLIHNPRRLMQGGGRLAVWLAAEGRSLESDQVFEHLLQMTVTLPEDPRVRVEALHSIARSQARIPGKALDADKTAMRARVIAESISGSCSQASTSAEVGAMLTALGQGKAAREAFQRSHQGLSEIAGQSELLTCLGYLASSYGRAGNRGGALMLLQDMTKGGRALESPAARDAVMQQASRLYRELGDIQTAQELAADITDPVVRDGTRYTNLSDELSTGNIGAAMTAAEAIQSSFFQARAYGMLGLAQARDETYRKLADESYKQARELASSLTNPLEKMALAAELARFASRAGKDSAADSGFAEAMRLFNLQPEAEGRDQALAILATNQARALRLVDARRQLLDIRDTEIAGVASDNLSDSKQLVQGMSEQAEL